MFMIFSPVIPLTLCPSRWERVLEGQVREITKRPEEFSGRWVSLVELNLLSLFTIEIPTSRRQIISAGSAIVIRIDNELAKHWAQGYHCVGRASRKRIDSFVKWE